MDPNTINITNTVCYVKQSKSDIVIILQINTYMLIYNV